MLIKCQEDQLCRRFPLKVAKPALNRAVQFLVKVSNPAMSTGNYLGLRLSLSNKRKPKIVINFCVKVYIHIKKIQYNDLRFDCLDLLFHTPLSNTL